MSMKKRSPYSSGKVQKNRRKARMTKLGLSAAVAFVVLTGVALLLRLPAITITQVSFDGLSVLTEAELSQPVSEQLQGMYAFVVPRASTFFFNRGGIQRTLREQFPRIKTLSVKRAGFEGLTISIVERKPAALWCDGNTEAEQCYFLDDGGYIFAPAPVYTGDVYFVYRGGVSSPKPLRARYLPEQEFRTTAFFIGSVKSLDSKPVALALMKDEFALYLKDGGKVLFVRGDNFDRILESMKTALASDAFKDKDLSTLEYLDLRFPNKIVYKWR